MSVKLNCHPKPKKSQKNSNFNGKTIPYPGFEPGTSRLVFGSHNHCTIGSVLLDYSLIINEKIVLIGVLLTYWTEKNTNKKRIKMTTKV
jgi:hypothetical protein